MREKQKKIGRVKKGIEVDEQLHIEVGVLSVRTGRNIGDIYVDALRAYLHPANAGSASAEKQLIYSQPIQRWVDLLVFILDSHVRVSVKAAISNLIHFADHVRIVNEDTDRDRKLAEDEAAGEAFLRSIERLSHQRPQNNQETDSGSLRSIRRGKSRAS